MTNGNLFPQTNTLNYRQGNVETTVNPLNDPIGNDFQTFLDNTLELQKANDPNCAIGKNSIRVADPALNNDFMFGDASQETHIKPTITPIPSLFTVKLQNLNENNNIINNNNSNEADQNPPSNYDRKKKRRDNKILKENNMKINVAELEGYMGEKSVDEILKELEPERAINEKAALDKKKKKKSNGVRKSKNKSPPENKDLDVEVELDNDDNGKPETPTQKEEEVEAEEIPVIEEPQVEEIETQIIEEIPVIEEIKAPVVEETPVIEEPQFEVVSKANSAKNPVLKSEPEAKPQQSNNVKKDERTADDKKNEEVLRRSWEKFLRRYAGHIYMHPDSPVRKDDQRKQRSNNTNGNKKDRKSRQW